MEYLTVGRISSVINAGLVIVQNTLPLAIVLILAGVLKNKNNPVTWSVVDRMLQRSLWPVLLRSDAAATRGVQTRVMILSKISLLGMILLLAASTVTPLGLSESYEWGQLTNPQFTYLPDMSSFGLGTAPRSEYKLGRLCGFWGYKICPGQTNTNGLIARMNDTLYGTDTGTNGTGWVDSKIPQNVTKVFTSADGVYGSTVANVFEIQFRNFEISITNDSMDRIDNGQPRSVGKMRFLASIAMDGQYEVVEGLVVDAVNGGIGFRNHSVPEGVSHEVYWSETLLWMEPETVCVDNNITIDYEFGYNGPSDIRLTDNGGLMDVLAAEQHGPAQVDSAISQAEPGLRGRAARGAFYGNLRYAQLLSLSADNVTKEHGTSYDASDWNIAGLTTLRDSVKPFQLYISPLGDLLINDLENQTSIGDLCRGFLETDDANITNIAVECGMIVGAARRTDSHAADRSFMSEAGSTWSHPIYTCATGVKSSLKQAFFYVNGTTDPDLDLMSLEVLSIDDMYYDNDTLPIWAVEKTGMVISDARPLWGLVSKDYENHENLWTKRNSSLYLPASGVPADGIIDTLAGSWYQNALLEAYQGGALGPDYSGKTDYAMFSRWKQLSISANNTSSIPNLIWTDVIANTVLGTRSRANAAAMDESPYVMKPVIVYDYRYAIPVFLLLVLWAALCLVAFGLWVSARVTLPGLRQLLNQTATGRAVSNMIYPGGDASMAPTHEWIKSSDAKQIGLLGLGGSAEHSTGKGAEMVTTAVLGLHFTDAPEQSKVRNILVSGVEDML